MLPGVCEDIKMELNSLEKLSIFAPLDILLLFSLHLW